MGFDLPLLLACLERAFLDDVARQFPGSALDDCVLVVVKRAVDFGESADGKVERGGGPDPGVIETVADEGRDALSGGRVRDDSLSSAEGGSSFGVVSAKLVEHGTDGGGKADPGILIGRLAPRLSVCRIARRVGTEPGEDSIRVRSSKSGDRSER